MPVSSSPISEKAKPVAATRPMVCSLGRWGAQQGRAWVGSCLAAAACARRCSLQHPVPADLRRVKAGRAGLVLKASRPSRSRSSLSSCRRTTGGFEAQQTASEVQRPRWSAVWRQTCDEVVSPRPPDTLSSARRRRRDPRRPASRRTGGRGRTGGPAGRPRAALGARGAERASDMLEKQRTEQGFGF